MHLRRSLCATAGALALLLALALAGRASGQATDLPDAADLERYKAELAPLADAGKRAEAIRNVAYYDVLPTTRLLVESLAATLLQIERLQTDRVANDAELDKRLAGPIANGKGGLPNYAGVEEFQARQKQLGEQITQEEAAVRWFVDALAGLKKTESLEFLMAQKPKKQPRLKLLLLEALGRIDDARVAEHLIGELDDPAFEVRTAAAAALLRQKPEFTPAGVFAPLLRSKEWQERALAFDGLARVGGRHAVELLVMQTNQESGRMLGDLAERLEQLTGQTLGKNPQAWVSWWQKARGGFESKGIDLATAMHVKRTGTGKYWGIEFDSLRVTYVIDISGSMQAAVDDYENTAPDPGKSRMELARREVKASLQALPTDAAFNLIAYSDVVIPFSERQVLASPDNKKKAFAWLDGLAAVGQTNIFDALEKAFMLSPQGGKDKYYAVTGDTILFMSDGGPTCGRTTDTKEILAQVRAWNETRRITIHVVGIGKQTVQDFLKALARENGGTCTFIEK